MTIFNEICDNCIYGAGMPIICTACGGIVRGGLCLPCNLREKNLYNYDQNAYSFDNFNYFPQPQDENYLCNLYGNNSHHDYDCQQQFSFVYEQEPSYNQNYDGNYYPHESPSFPCCDYWGGSHKTFQCQPDNQNVEFSGSDQIQTPQYSDVNPPSPEIKVTTDTELSSTEDIQPLPVQEPPRNSDIHQLIEECFVEVLEEQKQNIEKTMFDLVKICHHKEFLCIHDDVDDLIESALDSKLLLINSNSQHLDKKEQEIKNVVEQPAERGNRSIQSLQNFRVIHKSSISFKNTSQISSIHSVAPIQSTKEPEHLLSMGKCEVTLEDVIECGMPSKDDCSLVFTTFSNPLFKDNDDLDSSDDESLPDEDVPAEEFKIYSNSLFDEDKINSDKLDPHCFNDNSFPRPPEELNAKIADTIIESIPLLPIPVQDGNSQREEIDIVTETDDVLPPSVENDDDLSNDSLLGEADLFLVSDNSIPPGIENFADDPEGDIYFLEELLIDDSILSDESYDSNFEDNPSIPRPPPEPPNVESFFDLKPDVIAEEISDKLNKDKCFDPGREINVSTKIEDDDFFPFMFLIRFFLPYFILPKISLLFLSAENRYNDNKLREGIQKAIKSHTAECREEALVDIKEYIDLINTPVRAIIKEEVNSQLPQILPQAVLEFETPVIERNITESLETVVLVKSSSQPKFIYEAVASLSKLELTKILMDKIEEHKSYLRPDYKREIYDAVVKSYNTDKDLYDTYGEVFMLKRSQDDKDKDQELSAGSDRGTKRRKSSKDVESSRDPNSKESKSISSSRGTSRSQHKSSGKPGHKEEQSHTVGDLGVQQNQEFNTGNNDEQPDDEAASKVDWFKKPEQPPTPDLDWNK
uniref:Reverse transcriptase domain-containing protein n=1 Tax=Tanacetum cinerariifolium TaxID=118510 RepID=A0A6L2M9L0_TANCI|nr:hypothetical protein [Tanacetum cinerariifolium]